ncbi:MAG: hypothetical protein HY247_03110 [archaeon]|nr:MAG: hypothetical protein HY247_03110 [archaeon]
MIQEQRGEAPEPPDAFPETLGQIQGEYLHLRELMEKERKYTQSLAELIGAVQQEVDAPIPLSRGAFASVPIDVKSAFLLPDANVLVVDSSGGKASRPLKAMPVEVIMAVAHESTAELKRLLGDRRRALAKRVQMLEKVLDELGKIKETMRPETAARAEPEPEVHHDAVQEEAPVVKTDAKEKQVAGADYSYTGSFEEKRQALNGKQFPFTNSTT